MPKILIIEDQQIFQNIYQAVMEKEGLDIIAAHDGEEGLEMALSHTPELILLDMMMPKLNGIEFLKRFKPVEHPGTKVIVFSNVAMDDLVDAAKQLGAYSYLVKSAYFTPKLLIETVQEALNSPPK